MCVPEQLGTQRAAGLDYAAPDVAYGLLADPDQFAEAPLRRRRGSPSTTPLGERRN